MSFMFNFYCLQYLIIVIMMSIFSEVVSYIGKKIEKRIKKNTNKNKDNVKIFTEEPMDYDECSPFLPIPHGSVVYVCKTYDGDTLTICFSHPITNEKVRLGCRINGIDCPEIRGSSPQEKALAVLAKERLASVTLGEFVTVLNPSLEKYGRLLCDLKSSRVDSVKEYMLEDSNICVEYSGGTKKSWT